MSNTSQLDQFLPTSLKEMKALGWQNADVILFTGDAYVDHPSFGAAVIGRVLQKQGYKVAIVPQPNWRDDLRDFTKLGQPRLFFAVTAGAMDSMVNHYTANKRLRSDDAYTPDAKAGYRPDYPTIVYTQILKKLFPDVPVVIGGIEASLRRLTHYDYWKDSLRPSFLIESGADLLLYGMSELAIVALAQKLDQGEPFNTIKDIKQCVHRIPTALLDQADYPDAVVLHSFEDCIKSKKKFAENFKWIEIESNKWQSNYILESCGLDTIVVNPTYPPVDDIDTIYDLPYTRLPHPRYKNKRIPAYDMICHSVNIHRGCFGGCSFCTISAHQGKFVVSRSEKSILKEVDLITQMPNFKGYLSDVGGPSANMYRMHGKNLDICAKCKRASCVFPKLCVNLNHDHSSLLALYQKVKQHPKVKKAFIGSGIRYDLFMTADGFTNKVGQQYIETVLEHHVSGRLKVAPEHTSDRVLKHIRKPSFEMFKRFKIHFDQVNKEKGLRLQLIPYFISALPYCQDQDMENLAYETRKLGYQLEQVQGFTPTPMTLATTIYYTGIDPYTGEKAYVAHTSADRKRQQEYFFWYKKN